MVSPEKNSGTKKEAIMTQKTSKKQKCIFLSQRCQPEKAPCFLISDSCHFGKGEITDVEYHRLAEAGG